MSISQRLTFDMNALEPIFTDALWTEAMESLTTGHGATEFASSTYFELPESAMSCNGDFHSRPDN